jgi:hypothetical protein
MSRHKRRKRDAFRAAKEVKRLARMRLGSPPPAQRQETKKRKPPKHKKREAQGEVED